MLKELFDAMAKQAQGSILPAVLTEEDGLPKGYYRMRDGEMKVVPPDRRAHVAKDLTAVIAFSDKEIQGGLDTFPSIWYSRKAVVCLIEDADRRDRVTLPLQFSQQLDWLMSMEKCKKAWGQRELILLLRTLMRPALGSAGNIIDILRGVRFEVQTEGNSVVQHGKSSLGKSLRQEIAGAGAIPEYVTFSPRIWESGFHSQQPIECALEPDAGSQSFQVIPIPGQIEAAIVAAESAIGEALRAACGDVPVYYGEP